MFALVDCNNFYVSCERVFNPKLHNRPIVVLSNGDGCVVARSNEVKAMGIKMGEPWFKLRDIAKRHGIIAFSSNYALYADLSARVMSILDEFAPHQEIYSIDECFLDLTTLPAHERIAHGQRIRQTVLQYVGIPTCVGIAPSKTLAKLANFCAKKNLAGQHGVCDLSNLTTAQRSALFTRIPVAEIWGIGGQTASKLATLGIHNTQQLLSAPSSLLRAQFNVTMQRTVQELNGITCLSLHEIEPPHQQIVTSRTFHQSITHLSELRESIAHFTCMAASKLRRQQATAQAIAVFIQTNPHQPKAPQYQRNIVIKLHSASNDTRTLAQAALSGLEQIYRAGYRYKKSGVMLLELRPQAQQQYTLLDDPQQLERSLHLMQTMDKINQRYGKNKLTLAAAGTQQNWAVRFEHKSPSYTSNWHELMRVY